MVLGLIFAVVLAKGSVLKAIAMILTGLLLSMVGSDIETGAGRMTFDLPELSDGIELCQYRDGRVRFLRDHPQSGIVAESRDILNAKISGLMPTREDLDRSAPRRLCAARCSARFLAFCPAAAR